MAQPNKRDQVVEAALALFYEKGFNSTGVEEVRRVAGVSKKTLYSHFASKDDLILAVLHRRDELFRNFFKKKVDEHGTAPAEKLIALFDASDAWFNGEPFHGCMFINASAEFANPGDPNHVFAAEHKRLMEEYIRGLATDAGATDPETLAWQLNLLMDGATVKAHVEGDRKAGLKAKEIARPLIEAQFGQAAGATG